MATLVLALPTVRGLPAADATSTELFFSEYIEGSSNNKALEIYNGTGSAIDLGAGGYRIEIFFNGNTSAGTTINLSGSVGDGGVWVVADNDAAAPILAAADQTSTSNFFNGDDAVVLFKDTAVVDSIGQVGVDPGSQWGTDPTSTQNNTIRRKATVEAGDTNPNDPFDPAAEWDGFAQDTFEGLGARPGLPEPPDPDPDPDPVCDVTGDDLTPISAVQGSGDATPIPGASVVTRGVVTTDLTSGGASGIPSNQGLRGFFMEAIDEDRDGDPNTSEGIFVFDSGGTFDGNVGDLVAVAGTAGEFSSVTQVSLSEFDICATDVGLPGPADLPLPMAPDNRAAAFEPLESMRVTHPELTVVEFFQVERFGEIRLSADGVLQTPTNVHLPDSDEQMALAAANAAATIILDDGRTGQNLNRLDSDDLLPYVHVGETLRIGDQLHDRPAVLHFGFGAWRLQPIDIDAITDELAAKRTRPRPEEPPEVGGTLRVASFNVLNYFDGDGQGDGFPNARGAVTPSELDRQTQKLVDAITRLDADIYGLIEIENDGGEFQAAHTLVDALNAAAGREVYRFVDTGVIGTDAIKQAFIYNRRTVRPVGDFAVLTSAVDPRFDDDRNRPALAQTFLRLGSGERVTVVVNHLKSKGSACGAGDDDPVQGNCNGTRTAAAEALADWLATNPTGENALGSLIIGDINAYGREDPIRALEDAGYEDQLVRHTDGIPYTFTFDGMQGALDTALALDSLAARVTGAAAWHINADEVPAIDYLESVGAPGNLRFRTPEIAAAYFDPSAFRSSDHDTVLIGLDLGRSQHGGRPQG